MTVVSHCKIVYTTSFFVVIYIQHTWQTSATFWLLPVRTKEFQVVHCNMLAMLSELKWPTATFWLHAVRIKQISNGLLHLAAYMLSAAWGGDGFHTGPRNLLAIRCYIRQSSNGPALGLLRGIRKTFMYV
jgi:hypothetical protein